jgi:hypothetical protein
VKRFSKLVLLIFVLTNFVVAQTKNSNSIVPPEKQVSEEGIFVQVVRLRVDANDVAKWENAVKKIREAAGKSRLSKKLDWLLYRETPANYLIITFSDSLADILTTKSFPAYFSGKESEEIFKNALKELNQTRFVILENNITQQMTALSTVREMSTKTHPMGRLTDYWVKPGKDSEFISIMQDYFKLLKKIEYPYPIEGFRYALFAPGKYQIVTFPDSWAGFFGENDLEILARKKKALKQLSDIKRRLSATLIKSSEIDISFARELSFSP